MEAKHEGSYRQNWSVWILAVSRSSDSTVVKLSLPQASLPVHSRQAD